MARVPINRSAYPAHDAVEKYVKRQFEGIMKRQKSPEDSAMREAKRRARKKYLSDPVFRRRYEREKKLKNTKINPGPPMVGPIQKA